LSTNIKKNGCVLWGEKRKEKTGVSQIRCAVSRGIDDLARVVLSLQGEGVGPRRKGYYWQKLGKKSKRSS